MPAPATWGPCSSGAPAGVPCEQLSVPWGGSGSVGYRTFGFDDDGTPLLAFTYYAEEPAVRYHAIIDTEGHVRFILAQAGAFNDGCNLYPDSVNEGRYAFRVLGDGKTAKATDSEADGAIIGDVGTRIPQLSPFHDEDTEEEWNWTVGSKWVAQGIAPAIAVVMMRPDYTDESPLYVKTDDPDQLPLMGETLVRGDNAVFTVGTLYAMGILIWDRDSGARPLVRWPGDFTQGAANLGTDGKHIVWTHGKGKAADAIEYPVRDIVAAVFTSDPAALAPVRLRSDPSLDVGLNRFAVGCGYASHQGAGVHNHLVVRISDGFSWDLPATPTWNWGEALGITCEHLYPFNVGSPARVRLADLGPGAPPD